MSVIPFSVHATCEGYNNAMNALEAAIAESYRPKMQPPLKYRDPDNAPPVASINAVIDDLEIATQKLGAPKAPVPAQSYPRRPKPHL
ncbi:MAG TPA: hypothetical protein PK513_03390 [Alphaproteobacteria bacterium]|nr:hypothetical protein [Alphaproteobacteria bacterium]